MHGARFSAIRAGLQSGARPQAVIEERIGFAAPCDRCQLFQGRVFFAGFGPEPPLHPNCQCIRAPIDTSRMSGVELIRLTLRAQGNHREAESLLALAHARRPRFDQSARRST